MQSQFYFILKDSKTHLTEKYIIEMYSCTLNYIYFKLMKCFNFVKQSIKNKLFCLILIYYVPSIEPKIFYIFIQMKSDLTLDMIKICHS